MQHLTTSLTHGASGPTQRGVRAAWQAGVTLVELLTVMVIVVILMAIGIPSFKYVTTDSRMSTEVNELLGDLQFARSEAVREGQTVTVCVAQSTTPTSPSCATAGTTTWQNGWIVFSDVNNDQKIDTNDPVLRIQSAFLGGDTFGADNSVSAVTFNRSGFVNQLGASKVTVKLQDSTANSVYTRCLYLTLAGMVSVQTHAQNSSCQ